VELLGTLIYKFLVVLPSIMLMFNNMVYIGIP